MAKAGHKFITYLEWKKKKKKKNQIAFLFLFLFLLTETGHKKTFINVIAEASIKYIKDLVSKVLFQFIF